MNLVIIRVRGTIPNSKINKWHILTHYIYLDIALGKVEELIGFVDLGQLFKFTDGHKLPSLSQNRHVLNCWIIGLINNIFVRNYIVNNFLLISFNIYFCAQKNHLIEIQDFS